MSTVIIFLILIAITTFLVRSIGKNQAKTSIPHNRRYYLGIINRTGLVLIVLIGLYLIFGYVVRHTLGEETTMTVAKPDCSQTAIEQRNQVEHVQESGCVLNVTLTNASKRPNSFDVNGIDGPGFSEHGQPRIKLYDSSNNWCYSQFLDDTAGALEPGQSRTYSVYCAPDSKNPTIDEHIAYVTYDSFKTLRVDFNK